MNTTSRLTTFFGFLFLVVGCVALVSSLGAYRFDSNIETIGPRATGHVVSKSSASAANRGGDYYIEYWFELPDLNRIDANRAVSKSLWEKVKPGDLINVHYAARQPNRHFPEGEGVTSLTGTILACILAAASILFGVALLWDLVKLDKSKTSTEVLQSAH